MANKYVITGRLPLSLSFFSGRSRKDSISEDSRIKEGVILERQE